MNKKKRQPARLAVFGNPVEHSLSPGIHGLFAAQSGIELTYERVLVPAGKFVAVANEFLRDGLGFNITVPCKHEAFAYATELSEAASIARAVNTIHKMPDGRIMGDNTDGRGLVRDLTGNLGWEIQDRQVLLIGAGGAASGVLPSLLAENPARVHVYNRTIDKAKQLESRFSNDGLVSAVTTADLFEGYDLVINGTSAGLAGERIDLPDHIVDGDTRCYDMIYSRDDTIFNNWCREQAGCEVADGLGMLVEQAGLSFQRWFQQRVETSSVIREIRATM